MRVSRKISIYRAQRSQQGCSLSLGMLRLAEPPTGRARLRSSLKSPRNPITPFETSRVSTLHPGLYKNLREGARRVIGATAKPLYPIDGKAAGFDRRIPQDLPLRGRSGDSRFLSKPRIQPRVQGLNPGRFNGGYGVPRGFKGEKSKFPPNPLGLAERVYSFHRPRGGPPPSRREVWGFALPLEDSYTTPGAGHTKKISAQHPSPPLRRINQPFQRVDAAYALVIGGRIVVKRQNQFGV